MRQVTFKGVGENRLKYAEDEIVKTFIEETQNETKIFLFLEKN